MYISKIAYLYKCSHEKELLLIKVGFFLSITHFSARPLRNLSAWLSFNKFSQHIYHGLPVLNNNNACCYIGHYAALR